MPGPSGSGELGPATSVDSATAGAAKLAILAQDRWLEIAGLLARLKSELVVEPPAQRSVELERIRLASRAIESEHQLRREPFLIRVRSGERLELSDDPSVPAQGDLRVQLLDLRRQVQLVQTPDRMAIGALDGDVGEGLPHQSASACPRSSTARGSGAVRAASLRRSNSARSSERRSTWSR